MKLRCLIGSIGIVGTKINPQYGDIFEVADSIGENLVKSGYAEEIVEPPAYVPVPDATLPDIVVAAVKSTKATSKRRK